MFKPHRLILCVNKNFYKKNKLGRAPHGGQQPDCTVMPHDPSCHILECGCMQGMCLGSNCYQLYTLNIECKRDTDCLRSRKPRMPQHGCVCEQHMGMCVGMACDTNGSTDITPCSKNIECDNSTSGITTKASTRPTKVPTTISVNESWFFLFFFFASVYWILIFDNFQSEKTSRFGHTSTSGQLRYCSEWELGSKQCLRVSVKSRVGWFIIAGRRVFECMRCPPGVLACCREANSLPPVWQH